MNDCTPLSNSSVLYDADALIERLTHGIFGSNRQIAFVVGSALTAPTTPNGPGVPGVEGVIGLITAEFSTKQQIDLQRTLLDAENRYQEAFKFLLGRRGPRSTNEVIRKAVALARSNTNVEDFNYVLNGSTTEDACRAFETDVTGWVLSPGVAALGELAVSYPERFGRTILTTNFDPLIGVSISAAGGTSFRTFLHRDGNLAQTEGDGSHIVHLHGYWYGSDTLHTQQQLRQQRPQLRSSLAHLLRDRTVVILGYGGWDDVFTQALVDVVVDDNAYPEIIWCFHDQDPRIRTRLIELLRPGIERGRVSFYAGVDCHSFLPVLKTAWNDLETPSSRHRPILLRPESVYDMNSETATTSISNQASVGLKRAKLLLDDAGQDRPPVIDFMVGREGDLLELESFDYKVAFITGIGGQGKSALAAKVFAGEAARTRFEYRVWRDCKEQSEQFEDHLAHLIEALNDGRALSGELSKQPIDVLTDLFCDLTRDLDLLVIFDNVDHYVDLEEGILIGAAGNFIERFLTNATRAQLLFTCRPVIGHANPAIFAKRLQGLDFDATRELFALRHAAAPEASILKAHEIAGGHAFWLDLLAAQVSKRAPAVELDDLLKNITAGAGEIPDVTLRSIWGSLRDREKIVLQSLAESLRPTSPLQLSEYVRSRLNYNKIDKALRILRDLNLIVTKQLDEELGYELHPVIRAFIHKTSPKVERAWFIEAILQAYAAYFGIHKDDLRRRYAPERVRRWLEGAELCVNAGRFDQALERLEEVRVAMLRREAPGEFIRVTQRLLYASSIRDLSKHRYFDTVFVSYYRSLVNLGRTSDASEALESYEETLIGKDARYINYCDMQTYMHWMAGEFVTAIRWGKEGVDLKQSSGVDTAFSSAHHLALAQRDSGALDSALVHFINGADIKLILDPLHVDQDRGGAYYGNIGRCFHLMGQIDSALTCYAKSARLIERDYAETDLENQAYIRQWVGELLILKNELRSALYCLVAAIEKWRLVSPPKADSVQQFINKRLPNLEKPAADRAEAFALRWIASGGTI